VVERPDPEAVEQHLCADKGPDHDDVHEVVSEGSTHLTSSTAADATNPNRMNAQSPAKHAILLVAESLNAPWPGSASAAVSALAGARRSRTGWLLFTSPVLISCSVWHFTDRLLAVKLFWLESKEEELAEVRKAAMKELRSGE
jgi:hypothetical protein